MIERIIYILGLISKPANADIKMIFFTFLINTRCEENHFNLLIKQSCDCSLIKKHLIRT
jgi:hypothetical protein